MRQSRRPSNSFFQSLPRRSPEGVLGALQVLRWYLCKLLCQPAPHRPLISFMPQQLQIVARHDRGLDNQTIAAQALIEINKLLLSTNSCEVLLVSADRVVTFDDGDRAFSLVFADLPAVQDNQAIVRLAAKLNRQIDSRPPQAGFAISGVAPNWLTNGAPQYAGGGGPGARPVVPGSIPGTTSAGTPFWEFTLPDSLNLPAREDRGMDVDVAMLDTAPARLDIEHARSVNFPNHPLLNTLLDPGVLNIIPGGPTHLLQEVNVELADHDYVMIDHGLFVAGIIHSIVPRARLHLIEVLNPYGVGTLETIANGFKQVEQINQERVAQREQAEQPVGPMVVNCSLTLNIPPPEILARAAADDPALEGVTPEQLRRWSESLQDICRVISNQNIKIVAAAGNDHRPEDTSVPQARYPAAFPDVLGVGALNAGDPPTPASYSNRSDIPLQAGFATLGGQATGNLSDPHGGIIGIYTGAFPGSATNTTGWARWAGTSFAAPIISGAMAALIAAGRPDPKQTLSDAYTGPDNLLSVGEYFPVVQG